MAVRSAGTSGIRFQCHFRLVVIGGQEGAEELGAFEDQVLLGSMGAEDQSEIDKNKLCNPIIAMLLIRFPPTALNVGVHFDPD